MALYIIPTAPSSFFVYSYTLLVEPGTMLLNMIVNWHISVAKSSLMIINIRLHCKQLITFTWIASN